MSKKYQLWHPIPFLFPKSIFKKDVGIIHNALSFGKLCQRPFENKKSKK